MKENINIQNLKQNFFDKFILNDGIYFNYISSSEFGHQKRKEIYHDIDVNTAVQGIIRSIKAREYSIGYYKEEDKEQALLIEELLNKININDSIENILNAKWNERSFLEIEWDEDNLFIPKKLNICPEENFFYKRSERQWYLWSKQAKEVKLPWYKFLIAVNKQSHKHPLGESIFMPILKTWQEKEEIKRRLTALAIKYGEVIILSAYDPREQAFQNKTEEEKTNILKKRAESIKELKGKEVIFIPMQMGNIRDFMIPITLSDLKLESHTKLIIDWKKDIYRNIQGSTLAGMESEGSGNYALGNTHQGEKEKVEEDWTKFLVDVLQKLLYILGTLHNFDSNKFYFKFEKGKDRKIEAEADKAEAEVEKIKAETLDTKIDAISKLNQAGYELTPKALADMLGIEEKDLIKKEIQVSDINKEFEKKGSRLKRKKS